MDPEIIPSLIAAGTAIYIARMQRKTHRKVDATHEQMTKNHHESDPPTLLDRVDFLTTEAVESKKWRASHDKLHREERLRNAE